MCPAALQSPLQSNLSRQDNIELAGLDILSRPGIQLRQFNKAFLRDATRRPFPAHIGAQAF